MMAEIRISSRFPPFLLLSVRNDCFRFNFHQHLWRDQGTDRHHRTRGTDVAEILPMRLSYFLPIRDIGEKYTGADYILQRSASPIQCALNILESLNRLLVGIACADDFAIGSSRSCTRNVDVRTYANRTGVTNDRLPRCSTRNVDSFHFASVFMCK